MILKNFNSKLDNNNNFIEYYEEGKLQKKFYSQVYNEAVSLLNYIKDKNVLPNDRIGILAENSYKWIIIDLMCFLGGYISVPLHVKNYKVEELEEIITKFNLKMIFADNKFSIILNEYIKYNNIVNLDTLSLSVIQQHQIPQIFGSNDIFTIVSTSGTTSVPKAIELKLDSLEDFLINIQRLFNINQDDKIILFLPFSHFGQRSYVYGAIVLGFNILLVKPEEVFLALRICKPTILIAVPFFFENIYNAFTKNAGNSLKEKVTRFLGGKIRLLVTGSAPIRRDILTFFEHVGIPLYEGYGTNETGLITLNHPNDYKLGSVGKPFPNKEIIINKDGEIFVRGKYCWGSSYFKESQEKNESVFLNDGFIRTGDIGYFDNEGYLYINGRANDVIVLSNGKKIFPEHIENELNKSNSIHQSMVYSNDLKKIEAIIVPENELCDGNTINNVIQNVNYSLPTYAKIHKYIISKNIFSTENSMLT